MVRKCPHCHKKCIAPKDFKLGELYKCRGCNVGVKIDESYSIVVSVVSMIIVGYFFGIENDIFAYPILLFILFRMALGEKFDAIFLPLVPHYHE